MNPADPAQASTTSDQPGQGRRNRRRTSLAWAFAAFVLLGATSALMVYEALFRPGPELVVLGPEGEELMRLSLRGDPTWEVRWTDRATGTSVRDVFALRDGRMVLTDALTPRLDVAGLEGRLERGELRDDGDGGYWIAGIDEPIAGGRYTLEIGDDRAPTTLAHGAVEHDLSAWRPGRLLRIETRVP